MVQRFDINNTEASKGCGIHILLHQSRCQYWMIREAQEKWLYLLCKEQRLTFTSDQLCYVTFKKPHFSLVLLVHSLKTEIYFVPRLELMCCIFPHLLGNIFQKAQNILSPHETRIVV